MLAAAPVIFSTDAVTEQSPKTRSFITAYLFAKSFHAAAVISFSYPRFIAAQTPFHVHVAASAAHNAYTCTALIVCGTRVLELSFVLNVTATQDVGKAAAMAAAAAARHRAGDICIIMVISMYMHSKFVTTYDQRP